jgi:hypothetical protein
MGFWAQNATRRNEARADKWTARNEARGQRISARAARARADRIENARQGWSGRPLRTRTWVSGRGR